MNITSVQFFDAWVDHIASKKRQVFYSALDMPNCFKKPLSGVKIQKNYKNQGCRQ